MLTVNTVGVPTRCSHCNTEQRCLEIAGAVVCASCVGDALPDLLRFVDAANDRPKLEAVVAVVMGPSHFARALFEELRARQLVRCNLCPEDGG